MLFSESRNIHAKAIFQASRILYVLVGMYILTASIPAAGQMTTAEERGLPPEAALAGSDIDQVNLQNGNLHVSIPILSAKQRGGGVLSWSLVFDTQTWIKQYYKYTYPNCGSGLDAMIAGATPAGIGGGGGGGGTCNPPGYYIGTPEIQIPAGWRLASPLVWQVISNDPFVTQPGYQDLTCPTSSQVSYAPITNWEVVDPTGTAHPLAIYDEQDTPSTAHCNATTLQGPTTDGSGMFFNVQTGVLTLRDGTTVQLTQGTGSNVYQFTGGPMIDTNGNEVGPNDTMNRPLVTVANGPPLSGGWPSYITYTVLDSNGTPQVYQADWEYITLNPDICSQDPLGVVATDPCYLGSYANSVPVVSQFILPNGRSYQFQYVNNAEGQIQQITLPTGATITYTYADDYQPKFVTTGQPDNAVGAPGVATRTLTVNGNQYASTYGISMSGLTTTVTDPLGNVEVHTFLPITNSPVTSTNEYETSVKYSDSHGNLLRTVTNTYADEVDPVTKTIANARVVSRTTELENGQEDQQQTTYETFLYACNAPSGCPGTGTRMNPTEVREYDYGQPLPGGLIRRTDTTYQTFFSGTVSKPLSVTVYDGSGNKIASSTNEYDNYSHAGLPMQSSGAIQHSSAYGTTYTTRANLTAVSKWRNSDGALLTSAYQYDDAGNVLAVIDPNGDPTYYSYTDSWSNSTCAPSGQGKLYLTTTTNAKGQTITSAFNSCTGTVASTTDEDSQTTTLTYDLLNRIKHSAYPDGGQSTYCFSDDPSGSCYSTGDWSASETDAINSTTNVVYTNLYDDLGRTAHTERSDPQGTVTTDTTYDGDNRVSQVSNPYRTGDTKYWTTNAYDGVGRITTVTKADGSIATTAYSGNSTTTTDEAGRSRESWSDGLGRLSEVLEDPNNGKYETDYSYDVLGDVLKVTQKGGSTNSANWRVRTFAYNSLTQLLCSANPEITSPLASPATCPNPDNGTYTTGTIRYQYDNDGNMVSKIAPKENQQSTATVNTTYGYDNLNRLTTVSYNDGTPTESYSFDGAAAGCTLPTPSPAATYLVGRMSGMCDASGATAWSYDKMGRTITEARTIGSVTDQISYGYTYNGIVNSVTYPKAGNSSAFTVTYGVNTASQINSISSGSTTYAQVQSFWANGAPDVYQYGTNIQLQDTYNARLQPLMLTATQISPSNTLFSKTYDFHTSEETDNGNLWAVTDGLDSLGLNRPNGSANYNYDAMNRVTLAQTLGTDCSAVSGGTRNWGDSFTVDPWGNLTAKTVTLCSAETLSASVSPENQLSVATYDSAGNAIQYGGVSFTYDGAGQIVSGGGTSYVYDGNGDRVEKPGKLYWRGVGNDSLAETNSSDTSPTYYIFFDGKRIARLDPGQAQPKYYVDDSVGSTTLVTDYLGNPLSESEFFPYGGEMQVLTGDPNTYKFTGKERDTESGNDYFGARYYSSAMARFVSPDPSGLFFADRTNPQSFNLYTYALNNPLSNTDPTGLFYCQWSVDANGNEDRDDRQEDGGASKQECDDQGGTWITEPGDPETIANDSGGAIIPEPEADVNVNSGDSSDTPDVEETDDVQFADYQQMSLLPVVAAGGCAAEPLHIPLHINSPYGPRILNGKPDFHTGVDYRAPIGTPVYSAESGTVALAYSSPSAGNVVVVQNPFGGDSIYMHLSGLGVSKGQGVGAGSQIGKSGNTGHSTGPHLHFEQHKPGPIYANGVFNHATLTAPCQ